MSKKKIQKRSKVKPFLKVSKTCLENAELIKVMTIYQNCNDSLLKMIPIPGFWSTCNFCEISPSIAPHYSLCLIRWSTTTTWCPPGTPLTSALTRPTWTRSCWRYCSQYFVVFVGIVVFVVLVNIVVWQDQLEQGAVEGAVHNMRFKHSKFALPTWVTF